MPETKDFNIRPATEEDVFDLVVMGKRFAKEFSLEKTIGWDRHKAEEFVYTCLDAEQLQIFVAEHDGDVAGMVIGMITESYFSHVKQAVELAWYVAPEVRGTKIGVELLNAYEGWAREKGVKLVNMITIGDDTKALEALYVRSGYKKIEQTFIKEF